MNATQDEVVVTFGENFMSNPSKRKISNKVREEKRKRFKNNAHVEVVPLYDDPEIFDADSSFDNVNVEEFDQGEYTSLDDVDHDHFNVRSVLNANSNDSFYGLPKICRELFAKKGVNELYEWQKEILEIPELTYGGNVVYSAPTSGGKTLVAEICLIRTVQVLKKKALFILPFVSIVEEKIQSMETFANELNFDVEGYYGHHGVLHPAVPPGNQLMIATIEKASAIVNNLMLHNRLHELSLIVIDELHMLGEPRGEILETIITKTRGYVQILAMSATIPNLPTIANWLDAKLYIESKRPVPLQEFAVLNSVVLSSQSQTVRNLKATKPNSDLLQLIMEVIPDKSVLVFCATKKGCETTAEALAKEVPKDLFAVRRQEKLQLLENLRIASGSTTIFSPSLQSTIPLGIAHHHSGLTTEERILIEDSFRNRVLSVLCCTSTLAAGVNLPASRVIFKTPYIGKDFLTKSRYTQMAGRAGRPGFDTHGESYLLLTQRNNEDKRGLQLMKAPLENVESNLLAQEEVSEKTKHYLSITKLLLEAICARWIMTTEEIPYIASNTFYDYLKQNDTKYTIDIGQELMKSLDFLLDNKFIIRREKKKNPPQPTEIINNEYEDDEEFEEEEEMQEAKAPQESQLEQSEFEPTSFGMATFQSSFSISESSFVISQLQKSLSDGIIFQEDLHICYLLTPISNLIEPDWMKLFNIYNKFDALRLKIFNVIGVDEAVIVKKAMNQNPHSNQLNDLVARRFYNALILCDLINEMNYFEVSEKYGIESRGSVQNLMITAGQFSSMMVSFCSRMKFSSLEIIFKRYAARIGYGVKDDIIDLMQIENMTRPLARLLFEYGFESVKNLAMTTPKELHGKTASLLGPRPKAMAKMIVANAKRVMNRDSNRYRHMSEEIEAII